MLSLLLWGSGPVDPAAHDEARASFSGVVVMNDDASDGDACAERVDQALRSAFLGGGEVVLEGNGRGRILAADQAVWMTPRL